MLIHTTKQHTKNTYWDTQNVDKLPLTCNSCDEPPSAEHVLYLSDRKDLEKYQKDHLELQAKRENNWQPCPFMIHTLIKSISCPGFGRPINERKSRCDYDICNRTFCVLCRKAYHEGACGVPSYDRIFLDWCKKKKLRQCPQCKVFIEKNEGCKYVHCKCNYYVCMDCGKGNKTGHFTHDCKP